MKNVSLLDNMKEELYPMATETDLFERASIVAFYDSIERGFTLMPEENLELFDDLKEEFPNMDTGWYEGILRQAEALNNYLGHSEGSIDNSWSYAHYGGKTKTIPNSSTTDIIDYIWNSLPLAQKNIFAGKKDSWNTTDVYMVKKSEENKIRNTINTLIGEFGTPVYQPDILVGTINAYMAKLLLHKKMLGISLKKPTKNAAVNVTPTNLKLGPDGLEVVSGSVVTPLNTNFDIVRGRKGKEIDFNGNSLRFSVEFEAGAYKKKYVWESKVSSPSAEASEPRDLTVNNKGKYITATARNGAIPAPMMEGLVKKYTGDSLNKNIPIGRKFNTTEVKYCQTFLRSIKGTGKVPIYLGNFTIDGKKYSSDDFIVDMLALDSGKTSGKGFPTKIRSKLRHLRYIKMYLEASKKGKLAELISHAYFLSSKMNINQGDLAGPFVKIQ